jgi:hypothetical protein
MKPLYATLMMRGLPQMRHDLQNNVCSVHRL